MNPVQLWIDALRSGKYAQTEGALGKVSNGGASYCCLGVAMEVAKEHAPFEVKVKPSNYIDRNIYDIGYYDSEFDEYKTTCLNGQVAGWYGIGTSPSVNLPDKGTYTLMSCNDSLGMSFKEIADLIESNLL